MEGKRKLWVTADLLWMNYIHKYSIKGKEIRGDIIIIIIIISLQCDSVLLSAAALLTSVQLHIFYTGFLLLGSNWGSFALISARLLVAGRKTTHTLEPSIWLLGNIQL